MSNLLEKASILLTPTAYDDGKILSVKPEDGTGDFTFTRNSSATRVTSQGLIEDMQILSGDLVSNGDFSQIGPELVTNGNFATDSNWVKGPGWSISNGKAVSNNSTSSIYQVTGSNYTSGKTYKIVFTVSDYVSGSVRPEITNVIGSNVSSNGTFTQYIVATSSAIGEELKAVNFIGSIDNVSVKEVGQDWTLGTGWSIGEDKAIYTGTSNSDLSQNGILTSGKLYKLEYKIISSTLVNGIVKLSGTTTTTQNQLSQTQGTHTLNFIANGTSPTNFNIRIVSNTSGRFEIDTVSLIEITDDTNLPRIDYSPYSGAGTCGHWLFEPQSTNLYLNSEPTANESAMLGVTYESFNWAIGFSNCVKYGDNSAIRFRYGGTVSASTEYTLSAFIIMDDLSEPVIGGQTSDKDFSFVLGGGVFNNVNTSVNMGNNIWRVSVTATTSASPGVNNNGIIKYTAQSNKGFRVVGYQIEQNSFATSYIPTSGAISTRLADAAFGAGSSDLINSTEGVLYAEIAALANDNIGRKITLNNGSNSQVVVLEYTSTSNQIRVFVSNGSLQFNEFITISDLTEFNKIAIKYKENNFSLYVNGIEVATDTSGTTFPIGTLTNINFDDGSGNADFYGKTKCVAVFKEALADAELTCLTTI